MSTQSVITEVHPAAEILPLLDQQALQELADDIREHGLREWIELYGGKIIDGRNRLKACELAGVEPQFCELEDDDLDVLAYVLSKNLHRRHLTDSQRAMVAARSKDHHSEQARERMLAGKKADPRDNCRKGSGRASDEVGALLNVSGKSVDRAVTVPKHGSDELIAAVDAVEVSVSKAAKIVKELPKSRQLAAAKQKRKRKRPPSRKRKGRISHKKSVFVFCTSQELPSCSVRQDLTKALRTSLMTSLNASAKSRQRTMNHQRHLNFDDLSPKERQRRERVDAFYSRCREAKAKGNYFTEKAAAEAEQRCQQVKEAT